MWYLTGKENIVKDLMTNRDNHFRFWKYDATAD